MKLSIITINYNNKSGLQKTIDSILSQTFVNFDWIIIDGGSTDGSNELIEQNQEHFSYWCSEPDSGIYNAMNKGIAHAKGEYLNFMNSGDIFASNKVLESVLTKGFQEDIMYGNVVTYNNRQRITLKGIHSSNIRGVDMIASTICHQAAFIKRELFNKYGTYDESLRLVSDWKFFFEVILFHKCSVKYLNEDIAVYDLGGLSSSNEKRMVEERMMVLRQLLPDFVVEDYVKELHINEVFKHRISRCLFAFIYRLTLLYERKMGYIPKV